MAIVKEHIELHREVLAIPGFVADPFLMIGFQMIRGDDLPEDFDFPNARDLLEARGLREIASLDHFDPAADLRYDLNLPVPDEQHERYQTVYDVGTIEHVFDTRQCFENCARMVAVGGHYFIHTPVRGYFGHGMHTFAPSMLIEALKANGFLIVYREFCAKTGERLQRAVDADNTLLWVVGRKTAPMGEFKFPQQDRWEERYGSASTTTEEES